MSRIPINHDLIQQYRQMQDQANERYSTDDHHHTNCTYDSTITTVGNMDWFNHSLTSPAPQKPRTVTMTLANLKARSPSTVDRSLRSQGWVGGSSPYGSTKKPKRSWKLKNPADEIYVNLGSKN